MDHKDTTGVVLTPQPGVLEYGKQSRDIKDSTQAPKDDDNLPTKARSSCSSTSSVPSAPQGAAPSKQPLSPSIQPKGNEQKIKTIADELDAQAAGKRKRGTTHHQGIPMSLIREEARGSPSNQAERRTVITPRRMARMEKGFGRVGSTQEWAQSGGVSIEGVPEFHG